MNQINLYEENKINISENKFIQRMIIRNKIENTICSWIMKEFENYEKHNKEWVNNYYFIDGIENENNIFILEKINNIFPYILETFGSIIDDIIKCYYLNNDKYIYKINEIFIEKYEYNLIKKEYINYKHCDIVINISLNINSNNEFICFSDGINSNIELGDMIFFSSNTNHYKINTNNNTMYFLVGLINIYEK